MKATVSVLFASVAFALAFACSHDEKKAPDAAPVASGPQAKPAATPSATPPPDDYASKVAARQAAPPATNDAFTLDPSTLSLGVLEPNELKRVDFKLTNNSAQPLKILTVKTGCKCITLDFARTAIAPGDSTQIHVSVVGVSSGARRNLVKVTTDDPRRSSAELVVFYGVVPEVLLVPPKLDFGKVKQGEKAEQTIKLTLHIPPEIEKDPVLEPFIQHDLPIKITLDPLTVTPVSVNFRDVTTMLHAVLDTSKPLAPFQTELVFKPKEARTYRFTSIPVWGEVRAGTFFEHEKLVFTGLTVGTPATKAIRFYYSGEEAPTFADVATTPADFTEKHEVEAANRCIRFDVTCTRAAAGALAGDLKVKVGASDPPLVVHLTARE
jgi:hypothetical protein